MQKHLSIAMTSFAWTTLLLILATTGHTAGTPIKIAFVADFSAVSKDYSHNMFKAAQMAVSGFNAQGGVNGRPVEMIRRDGGNDPERHARHIEELVRQEKIAAVFGGASSPCVLKASAVCRELQVPYLVSIGNSQSIVVENGHAFVFLFEPNTRMESLGFSIFATLMPWQRYAWIGPDYSWGRDVLGFFKQYFQQIGSSIEWTAEIWNPLGTTAFTESIERIIASQPDAMVVGVWGEDLRHFLEQARGSGLFDKMAAFGWFSIISGQSERTLPEGIWKISRGPCNYLADKHPKARAFLDEFARRHKTYPFDFTVCCYDSLLAWRQAVLKAGSAEPVAVASALKGLSFVGLRGNSFIRAIDGQMNCPTFFGRLVYRPEYPFAVIESVIEIPAAKTWLTEAEIRARRRASAGRQ